MPIAVINDRASLLASTNVPVRNGIVVPRGDNADIDFDIRDQDGDEVDVAAISTATFKVDEGQVIGGNMWPGNGVVISKSLGSGIVKLPSDHELRVSLVPADTANLFIGRLYYELRITLTNGKRYVVSCGELYSPDTIDP